MPNIDADQLLGMNADQIAEFLTTTGTDLGELLGQLIDADSITALMLRGEAAQDMLRAAAKLDQADELEHLERLRAALKAASAPRAAAKQAVADREQDLAAAITAEREAEDRARAAADHHQQTGDAERAAQLHNADPATQTDALLRVRAAADVATRAQAAAEGATTARQRAEQALEQARAELVRAERVEAAAAAALREPGPAAVSGITALIDGVRRLQHGGRLDPDAETVAMDGLRQLAERTGVARMIRNTAREEFAQELRERQSEAFMPRPGHPLRPVDPGPMPTMPRR